MPFNKLNDSIKESLARLQMENPTPFQQKAIAKIKSGGNLFGIGKQGCGKTTTLIINTLQKLNCKAGGNAPRALLIVKNKEAVHDLYQQFAGFTKFTDLRVYMGYEELHIDIQKSEIFLGIDILISTPKNIQKLFFLNGASTSQLKIFAIDDAHLLVERQELSALMLVSEGIKKCQYVVMTEKLTPKLERLQDYFMENALTVKL